MFQRNPLPRPLTPAPHSIQNLPNQGENLWPQECLNHQATRETPPSARKKQNQPQFQMHQLRRIPNSIQLDLSCNVVFSPVYKCSLKIQLVCRYSILLFKRITWFFPPTLVPCVCRQQNNSPSSQALNIFPFHYH